MNWSTSTRPTPVNAKLRLFAAIDALTAADGIIAQMPQHPGLAETRNARAWAETAVKRLDGDHTPKRRTH